MAAAICIACCCVDSNPTGDRQAALQGASVTTLAFVLEEGVTAAERGLCDFHRGLLHHARRIMRAGWFEEGVRAERARVVAWLRETGRYDNPWNLGDAADCIERGEHVVVQAAQPLRPREG